MWAVLQARTALMPRRASRFQRLRDAHPKLTAQRKANILWYQEKSCASGWFCGAHPIRKQLSSLKARPSWPSDLSQT